MTLEINSLSKAPNDSYINSFRASEQKALQNLRQKQSTRSAFSVVSLAQRPPHSGVRPVNGTSQPATNAYTPNSHRSVLQG